MSPEQQRIAIAEALGWLVTDDGSNNHKIMGSRHGWKQGFRPEPIPDHPNDLNACHEFEEMIGAKWPTYCEILLRIVEPEPRTLEVCHYWNLLHATAAQRCEAFLKTINKWKNDN